MPFTISHAVAVLPFTRGRVGRWLVPSALVIGAWIPDLPMFLPVPLSTRDTHSVVGTLVVDPAIGLGVWLLWILLLRPGLLPLLPPSLAGRIPPPRPHRCTDPLRALVSVLIGALTHTIWDTFTHADRWGTTTVGGLTTDVGGLPLFKWLQYGCGVLGLVLLAGLALSWWIRSTPRPVAVLPTRVRVLLGGAVLLVAVVAGTAPLLGRSRSTEGLLVAMVTDGIGTLVVAAVLAVACVRIFPLDRSADLPARREES